ncbi:TetR/AcrR family transcriptional regulator [Actinoplanes sp. LDG1-06]|uniref:TetR/AcrR family transcriptional regulator n=1 Tax=Paractinoplanes ovalisporus TaxID=2810368 RepID=A0ABS2AKF7_9ACTN|nr:TetR/AcrR family transcriptional regulator [Actinoplanes ovalisporus]MBM2620302.1 TetR/AcrR family transcriptional regulator [Actinoplanes ovalisporus]
MSIPTSHSRPAEGLRGDAQDNRDRIVAAARGLYAERGPEVSMPSIARRAGVGVATVYRRFPTKEALLAEAFTAEFRVCAATVDDALADPDPWRGFCLFLEKVCLMHTENRAFGAAFTGGLSAERTRAVDGFAELVRRAQAAGTLRPDFVPGDLAVIVLAVGGIAAGPSEFAPAAARRLLGYLLTAFRVTGPLPPPSPLTIDDLLNGR